MRILIYCPPNSRAVDLQSVMELFKEMGHDVYLLTQKPPGDLHKNVEKFGVKVFSCGLNRINGVAAYLKSIFYVISFTRKHEIDVVFAHLQGAGLTAGIARFFSRFALYYVRHNTDEHKLHAKRKAIIINWLTNKVVPRIIAISEPVKKYLVDVEKIRPSRITRINLGYNFKTYLETDRTGNADAIRREFSCKMLIVTVARLAPLKRHLLNFEIINRLRLNQVDVKLLCLGEGPYRSQLQDYIDKNGLGDAIYLLGETRNVFDYYEASDLFLLLSQSEASNNVVKEAGYCGKPSIVCREVGDFEDYILNDVNGFLVEKENPVNDVAGILERLYENPGKLQLLGRAIREKVIAAFSIENTRPLYERLLLEIKK